MDYDLVVVGSGPGGYKSALVAAQLGAQVALVERSLPGGNCLNHGCIPKKTLVHLAALLEDVGGLRGRGLTGDLHGDFRAAVAHKDEVIGSFRDQFPTWLQRLKIDFYRGSARLLSPQSVAVQPPGPRTAEITLHTRRVILATGAEPLPHPLLPVDGQRVLSSRELMDNPDDPPASLLCLGAGPVGVELSFVLHQFGCQVTLVDLASRILNKPGIPERASNLLEAKFRRMGVAVRKGITIHRVERDSARGVHVVFTDGSDGHYERVLVAIGRRPHTEGLGLAAIGVETTPTGFVVTNEYLETNVPGIYAVGDVKAGPMTANGALHDAKVAATNAMEGNQARINYHRVPMVIDSALEIAAVGLSEERAEDAGFEPDVARASFRACPKARARNDSEGFVDVVYDEETGQLLGGCIVGPEAGEQIHVLTAACQSKRGLWFFKDLNYTHPSWCEELENAVDPYTVSLSRSGRELFRPGIYAIPD
ncbi:MAG: dihydrolipoyl dehydrogenase family protein [Gammaproteobacteria bacterium]|nr:NAD(P)/FAD-dependent oxidoreductase [Gammaproteobacteria bacterium]